MNYIFIKKYNFTFKINVANVYFNLLHFVKTNLFLWR
jgi:hypothetical protein